MRRRCSTAATVSRRGGVNGDRNGAAGATASIDAAR
jgi:hypothetical protein